MRRKLRDGIAGILLPSPLAGEGPGVRDVASHLRVDLDEHIDASIPPAANRAQAFTLWLRSSDFSSHRKRAAELIDQLLTANPFTTLQIVLELTGNRHRLRGEICESLLRAAFRHPTYLDRSGRGQGEGAAETSANCYGESIHNPPARLTPDFNANSFDLPRRFPPPDLSRSLLQRAARPDQRGQTARLSFCRPTHHAEEPPPKWLAELEEFATIVRRHDASDAVVQSARFPRPERSATGFKS